MGNGFSIDVINRVEKNVDIDLQNLFRKGAEVPWPRTTYNGFLSYKYCKALWTLGARTTMKTDECMKLIEDIITCANVFNYSRQNYNSYREDANNNNIYINAYGELTTYLRYLIIHYNSMVKDEELIKLNIPFINYLKNSLNKFDEIIIISYNYDIWLERLLMVNNIHFNIEGFENKKSKIKIIKPHGSISFSFKVKKEGPFTIRTSEIDEISQDVSQFDIKYDFNDDYPLVNAIIPPAGDSNRYEMSWVKIMRKIIKEKVKLSERKDKLIIYGISYWHVDRTEIDEILTEINPQVETIFINPYPPTSLDAVLTSLFKNYIHYTKSDLLSNSMISKETSTIVLQEVSA